MRSTCFVLISSVFLSCLVACSSADEATLFAEAVAAAEQGEDRTAIIQLKNILQKNPSNAQARLLLGELSLGIGDLAAAEKELSRALRGGQDANVVLPMMAEALLGQGKFQPIIDEVLIDDSIQDTVRQRLLIYRGHAFLGLGDGGSAKVAFDSVLEADPTSGEGLLGQASLATAASDLESANQFLDRVGDTQKDNATYWLVKGQTAMAALNFEEAVPSLERALETAPVSRPDQKTVGFLALGNSLLQIEDYDRTLEVADEINRYSPRSPYANFFRARVALAQKELEKAQNLAIEALNQQPSFTPAEALLGSINYERGELDQAEMYLSNVLGANPQNNAVRKLLAATRMRRDKWDDANNTLLGALDEAKDVEMLSMLGIASFRSGEGDQALSFLRQAVEQNPGSEEAVISLARVLMPAGKTDEALGILNDLPDEARTFRTTLMQAVANFELGNTQAGQEILTDLMKRNLDNPQVMLGVSEVALSYGQLDQAEDLLTRLEQDFDKTDASLRLASVFLLRNDIEGARGKFEQVLLNEPDNLGAIHGLAMLTEQTGNIAAAKEQLMKALNNGTANSATHVLLARLNIRTRDLSTALSHADSAVALSPSNAEAHRQQGIVRAASNDLAGAQKSFTKAVGLNPFDYRSHYSLARMVRALGDNQLAEVAAQKAHQLKPDFIPATQLLAVLKMANGKPQAAFDVARGAGLSETDRLSLEGDLLGMSGDINGALARYELAAETSGPSQELAVKLFQARETAGADQPQQPLQDWLSDHPEDEAVTLVLGQSYLQNGRNTEAVTQYERVLELNPESLVALNNLAWVYYLEGKPEAVAMAEKAAELAPDDPSVADTLGWILVERGDVDRGLKFLRNAADNLPDNGEVQFHLAVALSKSGGNQEAIDLLTRLSESGQPFPSQDQARDLLKELSVN